MSGEYFNKVDVQDLARALEGGLPIEEVPEGISPALVSAAFNIADAISTQQQS